ncbi:MAG: alpha/beta hydrolase [Gemmatimonadetes bacterium]|nr:alpha/beta hydrolase [Gemmatimonadota bacterium]
MGSARAGVPHLLVLHGLEGTVRAKYAHGLLAEARTRGWSGDLLLFRSCDGELNTAPRLYHSGETSDLDFIVRRFAVQSPSSPLVICGVSLGGNVLLKWLGDAGAAAATLVARAAAVSVPYDLAAGSRYLERGISPLYTKHFLATLKPKALRKALQRPDLLRADRILVARTFWEFDDAATAPLHGFDDAADYYAKSSSLFVLHQVRVPTLLFGAHDDPFVPKSVVHAAVERAQESPSLKCEFTVRGGHVGWVEGQPFFSKYYMERRVVDYLSKLAV